MDGSHRKGQGNAGGKKAECLSSNVPREGLLLSDTEPNAGSGKSLAPVEEAASTPGDHVTFQRHLLSDTQKHPTNSIA